MSARPNNDGTRGADARLAEAILYVASKCHGHAHFGKTKLNKILFFADFNAFRRWGHTITGQQYFRLPYGPVPRRMLPVLASLAQEGHVELERVPTPAGAEHRHLSKRAPDLTHFLPEEIAMLDQIIADFRDLTAAQVSDLSHEFVGWKVFEDRETIPPETVFFDESSPTEFDLDFAARVVSTYRKGK